MTNILILGNGAREKIIAEKLYPNKYFLYDSTDFNDILTFCNNNNIKLVVPSTEYYLCNGIVDFLKKHNISCFGPSMYAAKIEKSKEFSKNLMNVNNIPTPKAKIFNNKDKCILYFKNNPNTVIKYSGLAKGKGVYLPKNIDMGVEFINLLFETYKNTIVLIEEKLIGVEVSVMAFCNGKNVSLMPQAQDFKRIGDNDKGLNTGGMGSICPVNILNQEELKQMEKYMKIIVEKLNYVGILYAGVMKTSNGVYILEFNCRLGDPEAQVILSLLNTPLIDIIHSCLENKRIIDIKWSNKFAANVVSSHIDYPISKLNKHVNVNISKDIDKNIKLYFSNIQTEPIVNEYRTTGGRVLSVVSTDITLYKALRNVYNNIHKISYKGQYYRRDIGLKYLTQQDTLFKKHIENNENKKNINLAILASGNGTAIEKLLASDKKCIKVIITNRRKAGIIEKAKKYSIPLLYLPFKIAETKEKYYTTISNILQNFNIDLVFLCGFMRIVTSELYDKLLTINIHPSLLPNHKGLMDIHVHRNVIKNNDTFSGCTLHKVSKNVDEGEIFLQKQCIVDTKNEIILKNNIQELEKQCIVDYLNIFINEKNKNENENKNNNERENNEIINYDVNIEKGNKLVEFIKTINPKIGGFCSIVEIGNKKIGLSCDGCGTKIILANKYNKLSGIGIDLVAMCVNDLIANGVKPMFFMDYIAIDNINIEKCSQIIQSIQKGCKISNSILVGGETAEMKDTYLTNKFDLAGFAVGELIYNLPNKNKMNNKCKLYGIKSSGVHSNGFTLVRKLLDKEFPSENENKNKLIDELLIPTKIYTEAFKYIEKYNIVGISHITGGGFKDNINRILPENINFILHDWEFPSIFKWIQKKSNLPKNEMLEIFNCGYGMVLISEDEIDYLDVIGYLH